MIMRKAQLGKLGEMLSYVVSDVQYIIKFDQQTSPAPLQKKKATNGHLISVSYAWSNEL